MKKILLTTAAAIALTACATPPEPICDREAQTFDKFGTPEDLCVKPKARPPLWTLYDNDPPDDYDTPDDDTPDDDTPDDDTPDDDTPDDDTPDDDTPKDKKPKDDNSDADGKGGNKHNRADKDKPSQEIAERKKGV